ncbi:hypothetical protein FRB90_003467 [Tulasnella sp. 427]|nr:hypothetical protein FRB90_003467 [Tulasnella sp. 427]
MRMQSGVFDGMMDIPQPPRLQGESAIPIVDMPDEAEELEAVMMLIYRPDTRSVQSRFDTLALALPFLRKYGMDQLMTASMNRIRMDCPETLKEWDMQYEQACVSQDNEELPWVDHIVVEPAGIVALARKIPELESMLPVAFYNLSYADTTIDDTRHYDSEYLGLYAEQGGKITRWSKLTAQDLLILWRGTIAMRREVHSMAWNLRSNSRPGPGNFGDGTKFDHAGCSQPIPGVGQVSGGHPQQFDCEPASRPHCMHQKTGNCHVPRNHVLDLS